MQRDVLRAIPGMTLWAEEQGAAQMVEAPIERLPALDSAREILDAYISGGTSLMRAWPKANPRVYEFACSSSLSNTPEE